MLSPIKKYGVTLFIGVISGVIGSFVVHGVGYQNGYSDGFQQGVGMGISQIKSELEAESANEKLRQKSEILKENRIKREQFETNFKEEKLRRRNEFQEQLDRTIPVKYKEELQNAANTGRLERQAEIDKLQQELTKTKNELQGQQLQHERNLSSYLEVGLFWQNYSYKIRSMQENFPKTESMIRSKARAITEDARNGQMSFDILKKQLNGINLEIEEALKQNDLDKVRELISTLGSNLDNKGAEWRQHYRKFTMGITP